MKVCGNLSGHERVYKSLAIQQMNLLHFGLVTPYSDINLSQNWLTHVTVCCLTAPSYCLNLCWFFFSVGYCGTHLTAILIMARLIRDCKNLPHIFSHTYLIVDYWYLATRDGFSLKLLVILIAWGGDPRGMFVNLYSGQDSTFVICRVICNIILYQTVL